MTLLALTIAISSIGTKIIDWVAYMFLKPQTQQTTDVGTAMASVMGAIMPLMFMMMFMNMMMSMVQMPMVSFRR
jgi:hypothetical protein